ncbi:MAG: threonine/serine dehydratase [Rhizobiaceae bacterium]|nr:MAG: threonine/serine dehydratase [Rhizobiaceae bacterium]CAG1008893.1 threonine dehydratase [Rhizobiaceae bacterium]
MDATAIAVPGIDDVRAAARRLAGVAVVTPLLESAEVNERLGGRILFKAETLQRTGSFKIRGAYNKIAALGPEERARGVVAFSSGNHAQGVAEAARLFGIRAVIAMPADAPRVKLDRVRAMGAEIVPFDRFRDDRMTVVRPWLDTGMVLVPPYDDPLIVAGQGTTGLEIVGQARAAGAEPDMVVVPCGGGGLTAGVAIAVTDALPGAAVWGVEPEDFDDTRRSLAEGRRVANRPGNSSICDALLTPEPGAVTFEVIRRKVAGVVAVSDAEAAAAVREAMLSMKLVVEPGGAVGLAALLSGRIAVAGRTVVVVLSGGNVDPAAYARIVAPE